MILTDQHKKIIDEEESILQAVREAVRAEALQRRNLQMKRRHARAIDSIQEDLGTASVRDLGGLLGQLHVEKSLERAMSEQKPLPDLRAPYFAHMSVLEGGQKKDYLLGHQSFVATSPKSLNIVDWRHAPIAQIYFNYQEGDYFEVELPQRTARGKLIVRRVLEFDMGTLKAIRLKEVILRKNPDDQWCVAPVDDSFVLQGGEGKATRKLGIGASVTKHTFKDIAALLDKEQYRVLQKDTETPLLLLGSAGSGKTTVALYRMAQLFYNDPQLFAQHKCLVVLPHEGLVRWTRKILGDLNLSKVHVLSYDVWVENQARHVLRAGLPARIAEETSAKIIRFKRHPAVLSVLDDVEQAKRQALVNLFVKEGPVADEFLNKFFALGNKPLLQAIEAVVHEIDKKIKNLDQSASMSQKIEAQRLVDFQSILVQSALDFSFERRQLFGREEMLNKIVEQARGELSADLVPLIKLTTQKQMGDVLDLEEARVQGHDAVKSLVDDDEDVMHQPCIDIEDMSVLLHLWHKYTAGQEVFQKKLFSYNQLVVDEAQELSELEIKTLRLVLEPASAITLCGDEMQHIDPTSNFVSWSRVLTALGYEQVQPERLKVSYRCPQGIMDLAYHVVAPLRPVVKQPKSVKKGQAVLFSTFANEGEAFSKIFETLDSLISREPRASIAVITREFEDAVRYFNFLEELGSVRLVSEGNFTFQPGIDVVDVAQTRGLEFDYVILPDVNAQVYFDNRENRAALHVAITRAIHQLWVISIGHVSPLIKDWKFNE